ncbi:MAG: hypothetical protein EBU85_07190 [Actinobacteria bacterium]|nr:hypothetical protein [Actinomycetota bacterium]
MTIAIGRGGSGWIKAGDWIGYGSSGGATQLLDVDGHALASAAGGAGHGDGRSLCGVVPSSSVTSGSTFSLIRHDGPPASSLLPTVFVSGASSPNNAGTMISGGGWYSTDGGWGEMAIQW